MKKLVLLVFLIACLISCRQVHIYESRHEVIGKTESSLNDSVLIIGHVFSSVDEKPEQNAKVWALDDIRQYATFTDATGYYSLKLYNGTYTLNCRGFYTNEEFTDVIEDLDMLPNEKIEINFYCGQKVE